MQEKKEIEEIRKRERRRKKGLENKLREERG